MHSRAPCSTGAKNSHTQTFSTNCRTLHMCRRGLRVVGHAIAEPEVMAADPRLATTRVCVFSAQQYVRDFLEEPLQGTFPKSKFIEAKLDEETATMARGCKAVVAFVNDDCSAQTLEVLAAGGTKVLAMRCAGYDRVDLEAASSLGISVLRVPTYSPHSVAEHAVALMFTLNRHLHRAYVRTIQGNYSLNGLVGYEMFKKTVGVVGTGAIGFQACRILQGIGCKVLAHDLHPNEELQRMGVTYMPLDEMLPLCDIVTLHCPLLPSTKHIINAKRLIELKPGAMLINVSRGGLVQSDALHDALENGQLGALGMDVYENEGDMFFVDHTQLDMKSRMKVWDRQFKSLLIYPQVMVTPHSAFLTQEALDNIAISTITNISNYVLEKPLGINEVKHKPT